VSNKKSVLKSVKVKIVLVNFLLPLVIVQLTQGFIQVFNPSLEFGLAGRISFSVFNYNFFWSKIIIKIDIFNRGFPGFLGIFRASQNFRKASTSDRLLAGRITVKPNS
jgi:hypothetical protein